MIIFKKEWIRACGVYVIKNEVNNKLYIGSAVNIKKRLYEHIRLLTLGKHSNKHLQNSWNLYGKDKFNIDVIELVDINLGNRHLRDRETYWIQTKESYKGEFGYNIIPGGVGTLGLPCSEEKRVKISQSNLGKIAWNKGIPLPKDQVENMKKFRRSKGKSIDIYDKFGNYIETIQSQASVVDKYHSDKSTILKSCINKDDFIRVSGEYIYRFHGDPLKVKYLTLVDNKTGEVLLKSLGINKIFSLLRSSNIPVPKPFEGKLRENYKDSTEEFTEIINDYSINCKIARSNSNIADESRQP